MHAKVIVREVRTIFDDKEEIEKPANDPMNVMLETAGALPVVEATIAKENPQPQSVKNSKNTGQIRFPEDFTITEDQQKTRLVDQNHPAANGSGTAGYQ
ncbi:hypothetical protein ABW365_05780 [Enterococcus avium]